MRIVYRIGGLYIEQVDHDTLDVTIVSSRKALSTRLRYGDIEELAKTSLIMLMRYYTWLSRVESERLKNLQEVFEDVVAGKRYGNPDGLQEQIKEKHYLLATLKKRVDAIEALLKTLEETGEKG